MAYLDENGLARFWSKVKQYVNENKDTTYLVNAPIGAIIVWSGTEDTVPQGWSICNGENGTLDLSGKFVLASGNGHEVGETGGSEEVTLTVEQMPSHSHAVLISKSGDTASYYNVRTSEQNNVSGYEFDKSSVLVGRGTANGVSSAGASKPHPNMPPYYTALYIQKTGVTPTDYATEERVQEIVQEALSEQPAGSNVPSGGIIIWSGASTNVPDGWALCDGTNGTPDLRGRFVLGESDDHVAGETGGSEEVTLTVEQMPEHKHSTTLAVYDSASKFGSVRMGCVDDGTGKSVAYNSNYAGSSQSHNNMPPYYVLCYIMKL